MALAVNSPLLNAGDRVGVYVAYGDLRASGNHQDNAVLAKTDQGFSLTPTVAFSDNTTPANIYAYYPYTSSITNAQAFPFIVQTNQETEELMKSSQLWWGKVSSYPTTKQQTISLQRLTAEICVKITAGEGVQLEDLQAAPPIVKLRDIQTQTTVNLADGSFSLSGTSSTIIPLLDLEKMSYTAAVIPQRINDDAFATISWADKQTTVPCHTTIEKGQQFTLPVTISRSTGSVNVSISDWETSDKDYGGSVF
ncbi:MAG: fimbrillin family protein [Prevotella sp.]|nr:fimbrillin family protein [Prevotella sp.]